MDIKSVTDFLRTLVKEKRVPSVQQMEFVFETVVIARLYYPGGWLSDECDRTYVITEENEEVLIANQLWNASHRAWEKIIVTLVELVMCEFDHKSRRLFDPSRVDSMIEDAQSQGHRVDVLFRKVYSEVAVEYPLHMGYKHTETFLLDKGKWVWEYEDLPT